MAVAPACEHPRPLARFLFVTPYLPSPPRFGGQRRVHGLMQELARLGHELSVVALVTPEDDRVGSVSATQAYCRRVLPVVDDRLGQSLGGKRLAQLRSILSPSSWERAQYVSSRGYVQALEEALSRERYDVVVFEFVYMVYYLTERVRRLAGGAVLVLDEHNVEFDIVRRTRVGGAARRLFAAVNWRKLRREERRAWRSVDGCTVTSVRDQELLLRDEPRVPCRVVPNGVDVDYFRPDPAAVVDPKTVLFFGANNYYPNADGIRYFLNDVFPLLRSRGLTLKIVGPPADWLTRLERKDVIVTGFVDDVRPHLASAGVVIAPLRIGGGTRLKILEAMAMGKAVVSTSIGAEGLDVEHERNLLLGDDARAFARQVERLVDDRALAERLGVGARALVEGRYSWRAAAELFQAFVGELERRGAGLGPGGRGARRVPLNGRPRGGRPLRGEGPGDGGRRPSR
jgi:glycosyltransferase involved in cell wall biosynthesis